MHARVHVTGATYMHKFNAPDINKVGILYIKTRRVFSY